MNAFFALLALVSQGFHRMKSTFVYFKSAQLHLQFDTVRRPREALAWASNTSSRDDPRLTNLLMIWAWIPGKYAPDNLPPGQRKLVLKQNFLQDIQPLLNLVKEIGGVRALLKTWAFYVCLAQMVAGVAMIFLGSLIMDKFCQWAGLGVGMLSCAISVLGVLGVVKRADNLVTMHIMGALLSLSILFPLRLQVEHNTDIDCALVEIGLVNANLNKLAELQKGRSHAAFNSVLMRMKAMSLTLDSIHQSHSSADFNSSTLGEPSRPTVEHTHYKQMWRVSDEHLVMEQLDNLRESALQLMLKLRQKVTKKAMKVRDKYDAMGLETKNADDLEEAVKIAAQTAATVMRRANEHLHDRLPEDKLSIVEFDSMVQFLQRAMSNLKEVVTAVENEIGEEGSPLNMKVLERVGGGGEKGYMHGALENAEVIKQAMLRQQEDIYDHMDFDDLQSTKDAFHQRWRTALLSKINKAELDQRSYLDSLPSRCLEESKQEFFVKLTTLVLIFLDMVSLYIMFSLDFQLMILSGTHL